MRESERNNYHDQRKQETHYSGKNAEIRQQGRTRGYRKTEKPKARKLTGEPKEYGEPRNSRGYRKAGEPREYGESRSSRGYGKTEEPRSSRGYGNPGDYRKTREDTENSSYEIHNNSDTSHGDPSYEEGREIDESIVMGRNAVLETFRSGRTVERLYVQEGLKDGPIMSILREAAKHKDTIVTRVSRERLDELSQDGAHQGVVAKAAAFSYATVEDILQKAKDSGEPPFIFLLDNIEDPHNLGAIIRTANLCGAHGVIIPKRRSVGLTATAVKASAGAVNYTPVAKVTNIGTTIDELKKEGLWFVCADMDGTRMYDLDLRGPIGLVIGSEGSGVSRLIREKCDYVAAIPMKGNIDSLNASVAAGVLAYEIVRQRTL